jgi:type VI secretion system secreted protein VgrG
MARLAARPIHLTTPLGTDVLLPLAVTVQERMSEPFRFEMHLLSEKGDINPDDILGKNVCLSYDLPSGGGTRYFNGLVVEFGQIGYRRRYHEYQASVRPWFWLLSRTADCRIFQQKSVPEIFEEVVKQSGFTDYKLKLKHSYPKRDYCVQYRETDMNFLSRLLEEEGIYYFFEHDKSAHTMVLADDSSAHQTVPGYESVPYFPPDESEALRERDHLTSWSFTKSVQPGAYAHTDFDFIKPRQVLLATETASQRHAHSKFEIFDYPGELPLLEKSEAARLAKVRLQELQAAHLIARGEGNAAGLATGRRFKLKEYPREDLNIEYVITGAGVSITQDAYDAGSGDNEVQFSTSIEAIDARIPFRPARSTPKPVIHGAQTAMVVGPSGEEIYTDEHGRVKVQFHWDRQGKADENSSCWIRVAQIWAGSGWGGIHIPRIGQEVIVSFLEGDPDRPIITGRVYNGDSKVPYPLPANKTQSGIKSRSSKGGGAANFNEIRFEDKKGEEQIYIHAEKNQDIVVENDETLTVGHDRKKQIGNDETTHVKHDRTETVDNDEKITIGNNRTEQVGADESITIGGNRTERVGKDESITIEGSRTESVANNESVSIGANQSLVVGGDRAAEVGGNEDIVVDESQSIAVGKDLTLTVGKGLTWSIGEDGSMNFGKKLFLSAKDSIALSCGSATIELKKDGTITLKGKDISVNGSGKINVKAATDVVVKAITVKQN